MIGLSDGVKLIIAVARGERPWTELESLGVKIRFGDDGCVIEGDGTAVASPSAPDVARGLMANLVKKTGDLRHWAGVVLAASMLIDLSDVESHEEGDALLGALWDASFGEPLGDELTKMVERLSRT